MKKFVVVLFLAATPLLMMADPSEACGRRRCRPCPVPYCAPWPVAYQAPVTLFTSPKGRVYRMTISREPLVQFDRRAVLLPGAAAGGPDDYIGTDRGKAKTSIATGPLTTYPALGDLLDDVLGSFPDQKMLNRDPPLRKDFDFDRAPEENRNVTVSAWLYAIKKEANDNDYHLIAGSDPNVAPIRYMNMEISGLPPSDPARSKLQVPREALKQFLRDQHDQVTTTTYFRFEDPVPVRVTGSLFYDIDHRPGAVGSFQDPPRVPATAWEVHPISEIVFEP